LNFTCSFCELLLNKEEKHVVSSSSSHWRNWKDAVWLISLHKFVCLL
jgi:hypothetical protein